MTLRPSFACRSGVSTIEFGIVLPMILLGILGMVDVGRAVAQRMALDEALQSAARIAVVNPGAATVEDAVAGLLATGSASLDASQSCACAASPATAADCTRSCPDGSLPGIYYRLTARDSYDSLFLAPIELSATRLVRVR